MLVVLLDAPDLRLNALYVARGLLSPVNSRLAVHVSVRHCRVSVLPESPLCELCLGNLEVWQTCSRLQFLLFWLFDLGEPTVLLANVVQVVLQSLRLFPNRRLLFGHQRLQLMGFALRSVRLVQLPNLAAVSLNFGVNLLCLLQFYFFLLNLVECAF